MCVFCVLFAKSTQNNTWLIRTKHHSKGTPHEEIRLLTMKIDCNHRVLCPLSVNLGVDIDYQGKWGMCSRPTVHSFVDLILFFPLYTGVTALKIAQEKGVKLHAINRMCGVISQ